MKLRKLHDKTHREEHRIRGGKIKERTFDKNGSFSMFLEVSTLGYFASHYRVMRRKLDEIYDLVTALIFRGFQRLTEETVYSPGNKLHILLWVCYKPYKSMLPSIQLLAARGAMYVEVFNRVIPLAYNIIKRNKVGETNTYLDGTYYCFT
ncbi:hypothetical protein Bca4012_047953 [Brassica carinata]